MSDINELNDDCLKTIFSLFDIRDKLLLECVCLRWHQLIQQLLNGQKVLKIGVKYSLRDHYNCQQLNQCDDWIDKDIVTDDDLCPVLIRCPNIQYLYLCDCTLSASTLEWIVCQLRHIKCLSLIAIHGLNPLDWELIWTALANRELIHFTLSDNHLADIEITNLLEKCPNLQELHLSYYRHSLTHIFSQLSEKLLKLSLIECLKTNLDALKALVYGKATNIKELVIYKVPTYDENTLCEFITLKMSQLIRFSYAFDSTVPYIQPLEYMTSLQHLSLLSNEEYGIDLSSLITHTMPNVTRLQLNLHFDPFMLRNIEQLFPNVEELEFSFDRICCNCEPTNDNQNLNNNNINNINNNVINNQNNNNNVIQNNMDIEAGDDEPYVDDNCVLCTEKCILFISKLDNLKSLTMNGQRIKESAIKGLQFCSQLNRIAIDPNCNELNLRLLLITCIALTQTHCKRVITLKISHKFYSKITNIKKMPNNLRIIYF